MSNEATAQDIDLLVRRLRDVGVEADVSEGRPRTVITAVGDSEQIRRLPWEAFPGVERAVPVVRPFRFVSREFRSEDTVVDVGGVPIGGGHFAVIAGPCAVESRQQLFTVATAVQEAGATILRGDAFKPRTSPYSFQGIGEEALELLAQARDEFDMPFVAEVLDPRDVELVSSYADLVRVGTRNMTNFPLLAELGQQPKPVMLK
ncbi:MAG: 3-deoxy-7-phosphoheptulonate synthase, partial [Acidimicrobiia bacterium]